MLPDSFATHSLRPRDQLAAWRDWYSSVYEVLPKDPTTGEFPCETRLWKLGGLTMCRTTGPPVRVLRTKHHLRRDPVDHWVISYSVGRAHFAKTAETEVEVPADVPFLWSLGQEFLSERTHVDRVLSGFLHRHVFLARDAFRDIAPLLDATLGSTLDTPLGHLLGDYIIALERRLPDMTETDFSRIATALGAIVAAAVAPSAERVAVARGQIDVGRKERVRQAVRRHLRTPTLGPKTLGRLVGMSRSNIYRLFEDTGGVARYIQRERLHEAQAVLSRPETTASISVIAEDLCFADASSFSRVFKREFGCSPSEARSVAVGGLKPATPRSRVGSDRADFGELLRGF